MKNIFTILTLIAAIILIIMVQSSNNKVDYLKKRLDSANVKENFYLDEIDVLITNRDSLIKINDSLKYTDPKEIETQIKYKYGKDISNINNGSIYEWVDILTE